MTEKPEKFKWTETPHTTAFPVSRAGYPFIYAASFATGVVALLGLTVPALIGLVATFFICSFFRDPDRLIPRGDNVIVSPADGKVIFAGADADTPFYEGACTRVSIFMNLFNVHVNRIPHESTVKKIRYYPGKFYAANKDKAMSENEQNAVFLETTSGKHLCMVQVAGLVARRIICRVQEGDSMQRGQRMGIICFGSRVDVYLPPDTDLDVKVGTKVKAGFSVLGVLK